MVLSDKLLDLCGFTYQILHDLVSEQYPTFEDYYNSSVVSIGADLFSWDNRVRFFQKTDCGHKIWIIKS